MTGIKYSLAAIFLVVTIVVSAFAPVTLAAEPGLAEFKSELELIGLGSCVHQDQDQSVWRAVVQTKPQLFLLLGDNIYAQTEDMALMAERYNKLRSQPGFIQLRQTSRVLSIWDDNDYGLTDGGAEYSKKEESQKLFLNAFEIPKSDPRWARPGIYRSYLFGPETRRIQLLLLDTRYFRSPLKRAALPLFAGKGPYLPNADPQATILGEAQWSWLKEQLETPATLRLIASSIQVIADEHGYETWGNFPVERERLYQLLRKAGRVLIVSGDRHHSEISRIELPGSGNFLYDITASSLNMNRMDGLEPNRFRLGKQELRANFVLLRLGWKDSIPSVTTEVRSTEGKLYQQNYLPWSPAEDSPAKQN